MHITHRFSRATRTAAATAALALTAGKRIAVVVNGTKPGYVTVTRTSVATAAVR